MGVVGNSTTAIDVTYVTMHQHLHARRHNLLRIKGIHINASTAPRNNHLFANPIAHPSYMSKMVKSVSGMIREAAQRLPSIEDKSFGASFDDFANHRVVLIGDAR